MEGRKLDDRKLYFEIKEAALRNLDNSRELSNRELKEHIDEELLKRDKTELFRNESSMRKVYLPFFADLGLYRS